MLPRRNGLNIDWELRTFSQVPVVMATAGLTRLIELSADDYICKPYSPRERVIRVENILHRFRKGLVHSMDILNNRLMIKNAGCCSGK
ncbi:hypothetical protein [Psychromonas ingrahamii]|uniref:hypothetical protein n=1 Tax=Psychromonas ingrahamii TaxID=357794 RepID=UPI000A007986|nr:hypothetical protein [Psychromonas ingrahamii]